MWKRLHWQTREGKILWLSLGFLIGFFLFPFYERVTTDRSTWDVALNGKCIVLDPGHGGPDGGAVRDGKVEKEIALKITSYTRDFLIQNGAVVYMTREKDQDLADPDTKGLSKRKAEDLRNRLRLVEESKCDLFVSIHLNAIPSGRWSGAQTFYNPINEENKRLAHFVQSELIKNLENTERLPKQKNDIYLLKHSKVPTALVEVGFLSNSREAQLLTQESYQKKLASSIYYGILGYYSDEKPPEF